MTPWPYPRALAHRGGGALAPENTIAAIRTGWQRGFRGVEFDVMLSADAEPLLMHDETLERTTSGRGPVSGLPWADLARLDAGRWFSADFAGEPVPHLSQAIHFCRAHGVWINAEIKPARGHEQRTGEQVARALAAGFQDVAGGAAPDPRLPLLSSFSGEALAAARDAAPALPRGLLCQRIPKDWRARLQQLQCVALHCDHRHLDAQTIGAVHAAGFWVFGYTVNDRARAIQLIQWGIDAFCTDRLDQVGPALFDAERSGCD